MNLAQEEPSREPCSSAMPRPVLAVFDFDGTMTDRHTFWRYLRYLVGYRRFHTVLVQQRRAVARVLNKKMSTAEGREILIHALLQNYPADTEAHAAERFAREHASRWLRSSALRCLETHLRAGHHTVVLSNSAESYLKHVGNGLGVHAVLGTRLEVRSGRLTGRIQGESCVGPQKLQRLRERFGDLTRHCIYAYGDSSGDHALLSVADKPFYRAFT